MSLQSDFGQAFVFPVEEYFSQEGDPEERDDQARNQVQTRGPVQAYEQD